MPTKRELEEDNERYKKSAEEYERKYNKLLNDHENGDMLILPRPPKVAKNEYCEQKPTKYVFKCMDGDIHIPEYGLLQTDFYYQVWVK